MSYSVVINSFEIFDPVITDPAVHHEIVIKADGENLLTINGVAVDRQSGDILDHMPAQGQSATIQAITLSGEDAKSLGDNFAGEKVNSTTIFETDDPEKAGEIVGKALDIAHKINEANIDYIGFDMFHEAQNSNSVVNTIIEKTGFELPPEVKDLFAPGDDRILVPENYEPQPREGFANKDAANPDNVSRQVRAAPDPYAPGGDKSHHSNTRDFESQSEIAERLNNSKANSELTADQAKKALQDMHASGVSLEDAPPELEALIEVQNYPEMFQAVFDELQHSGGLEEVENYLKENAPQQDSTEERLDGRSEREPVLEDKPAATQQTVDAGMMPG